MAWGQWHDKGGQFKVRVGDAQWFSEYRGRAPVEIMDTKTGEVIRRSGEVRIIGNFSPIWVSLRGKKIQLEELLRIGW